MKDRYLFKAKRVDNGKWVIGYYGVIGKRNVIIEKYAENYYCPDTCESRHGNQIHEVNSNTICQCTGLKDKNGKLIWENDILHNGNYFVVKWNESCSRFDIVLNNSNNIPIGKWEPMICDWKTSDFKEYRKAVDYEVIGNVFDNPELLEREKK